MNQSKPWLNHYPKELDPELNFPNESLVDLMNHAAEIYHGNKAITFLDKTFTFKEVAGVVQYFGSALYQSGVEKGDRIGIMLPNCAHYIFALFGGFYIGAIAVQVNPMYVDREIEYVLIDSGAETMVVYDAFYPLVKKVQPHTSLKQIIVVNFDSSQKISLEDGDVYFEDFISKGMSNIVQPASFNPSEDVAVLQYTGGTTGVSKGVMLTHQNLRANVEQVYDFMYRTQNVPNNPKVLSVLPMFHIFGLTCNVFSSFRSGANQIILPRFDVEEVLATAHREKPYQMAGVPTMYVALNDYPKLKESDFDQISFFNSGGSAMPVEQLHYFEKQIGKYLYEGYGLSEASPVTHFNPPFSERKVGSIGIPVTGTHSRTVVQTEDGLKDVALGEVGELAIKGPQVMKGYWEKPEETEAVLVDGWLLTGDLARMDEEGYFYIVDRKKDMIVASGYNVYPREIEEVLYQHPAVQEVIVVGVPDPYRGESVKAYISLKAGQTATEEEMIDFSRKSLATYKVPREIEFRKDLPKSAVGKLLRRRLRDEAQRESRDKTS